MRQNILLTDASKGCGENKEEEESDAALSATRKPANALLSSRM